MKSHSKTGIRRWFEIRGYGRREIGIAAVIKRRRIRCIKR